MLSINTAHFLESIPLDIRSRVCGPARTHITDDYHNHPHQWLNIHRHLSGPRSLELLPMAAADITRHAQHN